MLTKNNNNYIKHPWLSISLSKVQVARNATLHEMAILWMFSCTMLYQELLFLTFLVCYYRRVQYLVERLRWSLFN